MVGRRYAPEQIIAKLWEADVRLAQGERPEPICKSIGITPLTYYRWRREYGGLKVDQTCRMKDLERENQRLRKAVSNLTFDALILREVVKGSTEF